MKLKLLYVLLVMSVSNFATASQYECKDSQSTNTAYLEFTPTNIMWVEEFHSASSRGLKLGAEEAVYSDLKDYQLFRLIDFYTSPHSSNVLAASPSILLSSENGDVTTFFEKDSQKEELTHYICRKINNPSLDLKHSKTSKQITFEELKQLMNNSNGFEGQEEAFGGDCKIITSEENNEYIITLNADYGLIEFKIKSNAKIFQYENEWSSHFTYENPDAWGNYYGIPTGEVTRTSYEDGVYDAFTMSKIGTTLTCSTEG